MLSDMTKSVSPPRQRLKRACCYFQEPKPSASALLLRRLEGSVLLTIKARAEGERIAVEKAEAERAVSITAQFKPSESALLLRRLERSVLLL